MDKLNEYQYLKKSKKGKYRIIYPAKDEQGNLIWKNVIGLRSETFWSLLILLLLMFAAWSYSYDTENCRELLETPGLKDCLYYTQLNFQHQNTSNEESTWNISISNAKTFDTLHQ